MNRFLKGLAVVALCVPAVAGPIDPPTGPIGPTMKSLNHVEPRIPIGPETTPGDANSVFRIDTAGSYYLTGDVGAEAGEHGIEISASNVVIDLSGFLVRSVSAGSLAPITASGASRIHIRNGFVEGIAGADAIDLGTSRQCVVEGVSVSSGDISIDAGASAIVRNCTVERSRTQGIVVGSASVVERCTVVDSPFEQSIGITALGASVVRECTVAQYRHIGIRVGPGSRIVDSTVSGPGHEQAGFIVGSASIVTGSIAIGNEGFGFFAQMGVRISECIADQNGSDGFSVASRATLRDNTATFNGLAPGLGSGLVVRGGDSRVIDNLSTSNTRYGIQIQGTTSTVTGNTATGHDSLNYWFNSMLSNFVGPMLGIGVSSDANANFAAN